MKPWGNILNSNNTLESRNTFSLIPTSSKLPCLRSTSTFSCFWGMLYDYHLYYLNIKMQILYMMSNNYFSITMYDYIQMKLGILLSIHFFFLSCITLHIFNIPPAIFPILYSILCSVRQVLSFYKLLFMFFLV